MNMQARIRLANISRAKRMREERELEMARLYSTGYKLGITGAPRHSALWDAAEVLLGFPAAVAIVGFIAYWLFK